MDKVDKLTMSSEVMINDILSQLKEIAEVASTLTLYLSYSKPEHDESRKAFREVLISAEDLSRQARLIFEELCSLNGNPLI